MLQIPYHSLAVVTMILQDCYSRLSKGQTGYTFFCTVITIMLTKPEIIPHWPYILASHESASGMQLGPVRTTYLTLFLVSSIMLIFV